MKEDFDEWKVEEIKKIKENIEWYEKQLESSKMKLKIFEA